MSVWGEVCTMVPHSLDLWVEHSLHADRLLISSEITQVKWTFYQDMRAKIAFMNLTAMLCHKAQKNVVAWDGTWIPAMCVKWCSPTARWKSWKENWMTRGWKSKFFSQTCRKEEWSLLILNFSAYRVKKKAQLEQFSLCSSALLFLQLPGGIKTSLHLVPLREVTWLLPLQCILLVTEGSLKHLHSCCTLLQ